MNKATSVSVQCLDNSYALTLSSQLMRNFLILTFSNPDIALVLKKVKVSKVNSQNVEQTIDGETGWRMVVPTTLKCFLCGGQVIYKNKDTTRSRTTSPSPSSAGPEEKTTVHEMWCIIVLNDTIILYYTYWVAKHHQKSPFLQQIKIGKQWCCLQVRRGRGRIFKFAQKFTKE